MQKHTQDDSLFPITSKGPSLGERYYKRPFFEIRYAVPDKGA